MEKIKYKKMILIPEEKDPIFVKQVIGENHIDCLKELSIQEHICYNTLSEYSLIENFIRNNYAIIINANNIGIIYLPTKLSEKQKYFFEIYKDQIDDYESVSVAIYSAEKTSYGTNYRDLEIESEIKHKDVKELLYEEINNNKNKTY